MVWQTAIIFYLVFSTVKSFLDKRLVGRLDPLVLYFYTSIYSGIFLILSYLWQHGFKLTFYPEMVIYGAICVAVIGSYLTAIKISLSQTSVFGSYYLIIPMVLSAVFLGEWQLFDPSTSIGIKNIAGVILALMSLYFLLKTSSRKEEKMEKKWLVLILFFIITNGLITFWSKSFLGSHGPLETLVSQTIGGWPIILMIVLLGKKQVTTTRANHLLMLIDGIAVFLSAVFFYQTIKNGAVALVLPIMTLVSTIIISLIGLVFYQEAHLFKKGKIWGLVLGIVGVALLVV